MNLIWIDKSENSIYQPIILGGSKPIGRGPGDPFNYVAIISPWKHTWPFM